jgi:hypothetical protein
MNRSLACLKADYRLPHYTHTDTDTHTHTHEPTHVRVQTERGREKGGEQTTFSSVYS